MENEKIGALIKKLRLEKGLTQAALGEKLMVGGRAVSKWERGLGCPDISLLPLLSDIFSVNIEGLLSGRIAEEGEVKNNMKKVGFYVCPKCGNIIASTGDAEVSCCSRKLTRLTAKPADAEHTLTVETVEDEYFLSCGHEMTKEHSLLFIAFVNGDRLQLIRLYPEWNAQARLYARGHGILYVCCGRDGLFRQLL